MVTPFSEFLDEVITHRTSHIFGNINNKISIVVGEILLPDTKEHDIIVMGSEFGSTSFIIAFAASEIINRAGIGIRASSMETTGSSARVLMLDEMDPNQPIIIAPAVTFWDARYGRGRFKQAYPKLRWMAALNVEHIFLIPMDKNIKTREDLIGKRCSAWVRQSQHMAKKLLMPGALPMRLRLSSGAGRTRFPCSRTDWLMPLSRRLIPE